ncbi:MAG: 3-isopropylmalate dehydratase [Thermoleophilia bacterium]|nr:3-isopropylmalate dehydratase [Thermoleophilia bacterium]
MKDVARNRQGTLRETGKVHLLGDDINTDYIIPAVYLCLYEPEELGRHVLEGLGPEYPARLEGVRFVFAGRNFGSGSAREQAPNALLGAGIRGVVAQSFGRIFYRNSINVGLPVIECPDAVAAVEEGEEATIDLTGSVILLGTRRFAFAPFPPNVQEIILAGGIMPLLKEKLGR